MLRDVVDTPAFEQALGVVAVDLGHDLDGLGDRHVRALLVLR
jgi:hypothetical protein